jgi:hypothetical protein
LRVGGGDGLLRGSEAPLEGCVLALELLCEIGRVAGSEGVFVAELIELLAQERGLGHGNREQ